VDLQKLTGWAPSVDPARSCLGRQCGGRDSGRTDAANC